VGVSEVVLFFRGLRVSQFYSGKCVIKFMGNLQWGKVSFYVFF